MDFAALPPEVNSARMYAGAGAGPLLAAATTWDNLSAELAAATADYGSVVTNLATGQWRGPASASMVAAAAPYVTWMSSAAAQAQLTAIQAKAAAGAYEVAFAMTVPPPVIAANRALLASLVATNFLGQNTPAIAATEAHYAEMWAQDAAAMYGYAGSSAAASALAPFTQPPVTTTTAGPVLQAAAVTQATGTATVAGTQTALSQLTTTIPQTLQGLSSPASSTLGSSGFLGSLFPDGLLGSEGLGLNSNIWNTIFSSGFFMPGNYLGTMTDFAAMAGVGGAAEAAEGAAAAGGAAAAEGLGGALAGPLGGLGGLGGVAAGLGQAASIGPLSVPAGWTAMSPIAAGATALPNLAQGIPPGGVTGGPGSLLGGMPLTGAGGHGLNGSAPRYGFRPSVMAHPPAAG